jgi:putative zinc finger/helix-turn-helix YgiT family protein
MDPTRAHGCGGSLVIQEQPGTFHIGGTDVPVTELYWRCDLCGEELLTEDLAELIEQEAAEAFRRMYRRLAPGEIRAIRERLGLTQELIERALGLGPKTWVRWESGRVLPNRAADNLLRLIERDCGALIHLAELNGIELPPTCSEGIHHIADGRRWPSMLVNRLQSAADRQETDLNSYLIMILTEHLTNIDRVDSTRRDQVHRSGYTSAQPEEPWLREHREIMPEHQSGTGDVIV